MRGYDRLSREWRSLRDKFGNDTPIASIPRPLSIRESGAKRQAGMVATDETAVMPPSDARTTRHAGAALRVIQGGAR